MLSILLSLSTNVPTHPHLAQAWTAMSTGDGLPGKTDKESYIYEDCKEPSESCMRGHVFNYGEDTCIKYEVDAGVHSPYTGKFYVKCEATNCCVKDKHMRPTVKKWDIGQAGKLFGDNITYLGKRVTTGLDNTTTLTADAWNEIFSLPFTRGAVKVNYTYFVTTEGNDTITHRIDYSAPGDPKLQAGKILYGDFKVQHDLDTFRDVFKAPPECLKHNVLTCAHDKVEEWDRKYFRRGPN